MYAEINCKAHLNEKEKNLNKYSIEGKHWEIVRKIVNLSRFTFTILDYYLYNILIFILIVAPNSQRPTWLFTLFLRLTLFKASLFPPSQKISIFIKSFFRTSSSPILEWPPFCLTLEGWPKGWSLAECHPSST